MMNRNCDALNLSAHQNWTFDEEELDESFLNAHSCDFQTTSTCTLQIEKQTKKEMRLKLQATKKVKRAVKKTQKSRVAKSL